MDSTPIEIICHITLKPGEPLALPREAAAIVGPGEWQVSIRPTMGSPGSVRDHSAFLESYAPEDEGLYDDF